MAERTGLEPATPGVTGRYSNQLNYRSAAGCHNPDPYCNLSVTTMANYIDCRTYVNGFSDFFHNNRYARRIARLLVRGRRRFCAGNRQGKPEGGAMGRRPGKPD